jgi:hypothetical protein
MKSPHRLFASSLVALATFFSGSDASAITREEVLVRARAYAQHRWSSTAANQTASCSAAYQSLFPAGDYVGLPYDWGGYMSLFTFDQQIAQGYGAGSQETDGILDCTAGVDCSGFVSMAWSSGHYTTSSIPGATSAIATTDLLPGDVFNKAGYHVAMFTHALQSGAPALVEAAGYNVHVNTFGGWSYVNGYSPRRYPTLTGTTAGNPLGTTTNPIVIGGFPYTDSRNTALSPSAVLDACGAAPATPEKGPEVVYRIDVKQPGTLSVTVQDDAATDVDVELLSNLSTAGCTARNDSAISAQVGCGTYWIVVDTYGNGSTNAGPYTLNVSLAPSGQACGAVAGPPAFNPKGKLGDACAYPGNESLPFCNPNLGAETCIYGSGSSFCSKACTKDAECSDLPGGGCCQDLGKGETYCMTKSYCPAGSSSGGASSGGASSGGASSGGGASSSSGGEGEGAGGDGEGGGNGASLSGSDGSSGGCSAAPSSSAHVAWIALALSGLALARRRRRS